jgi:glycosyltransferase involved in cell wall biosynthesis
MVSKKILYIVAHRLGRSPGQRFRFEQYLNYLSQNGFEYRISNFLNEDDDRAFYSKGNYLRKFLILLKSIFQRIRDVWQASEYDIIFIYRDAIMIGTTFFEKRFHKSHARVVFDFDDAIWFPEVSEGNSNLAWLKKPSKTRRIIELSDMIFAGNAYLADYARQYNPNVKIVPTTIDSDYYIKSDKKYNPEISTNNDELIRIGWTGTSTTIKYLQLAEPVLKKIKEKYGKKVCFRVISDVSYKPSGLEIENIKWKKETEIDDLSLIDIGIMPLPDDKFARGKCGFKGLQFMALEIPAVMSPVGVNNDIISNGINGFLPKNDDEWFEVLSKLIESKELRQKTGKEGRRTVIEKYSYLSLRDKYISYFNELVSKTKAPD